jgi:hypothetical protein
MSNRPTDYGVLALRWIAWIAFWWLLIPAHILRSLIPDGLYAKTFGWVKMKAGFWQYFCYEPSAHDGRSGFGSAPHWIKNNIEYRRKDQTLDMTGRSYHYRVEIDGVAKKQHRVRYYRKLKATRLKRLVRTVLPRYPRTRTELTIKLVIAVVLALGAVSLL